MLISGYFIDANLLALLVVGRVSRDLISKHRRLRAYTVDLDLYTAVMEKSVNEPTAVNFIALRDS